MFVNQLLSISTSLLLLASPYIYTYILPTIPSPLFSLLSPDIANTDIMKQTGERWRAMSPEEKHPWEALAAQDKQRYDEEMAAHNAAAQL
jgi:hypothetical protein